MKTILMATAFLLLSACSISVGPYVGWVEDSVRKGMTVDDVEDRVGTSTRTTVRNDGHKEVWTYKDPFWPGMGGVDLHFDRGRLERMERTLD